ncbi:amidase [Phreatobacter stygius]|uniref:Indoleacetamide hydrolase n=1 Tax=Phreatobacter stygius TaxID=1940610 RepID=A0A4D7BKD9_9HYPH|nr:amidase [Phreatobacter stygius]QCI68222.1 amidase [Phreatobacter stygius]
MAVELNSLSAVDLVRAYRARSLSPVEVIEASLTRLGTVDTALNAFCLVDEAAGRRMASESEARWRRGEPLGPLDGVPVAVKDTNHVTGWPMRFGSRTMPDTPSQFDTPGVARLREAGAVFFCKTTTPEYGWKGITHGPLTGITRNPWNPAKTPGGSSGGAAVAVATGVAPLATGGDGGGSIRIPASFTGLFGLKATFGLVPNFAHSLGTLGVFGGLTRTVADSALMLTVIGRPDGRDAFAVPFRDVDYADGLDRGVEGLRIAYARDLGFPDVDGEVAAAVAAGVGALSRAGAAVSAVSLDLSGLRRVMGVIWRSGYAGALRHLTGSQLQMLEPELLELVVQAGRISAADLQWAQDECRALSNRMQAFHGEHDLLVTPTMPITAFDAGIDTPDRQAFPEWFDWTPFTWPFNLSRQPAASVPCGFTTAGLPVGLQLVGPAFREDLVLRASRVVERDLPQKTLAWG